jgi:hypothetical protein
LKKTPNAALKKTGGTAKPKSQPAAVERPGAWHLARTETERRLSDFEFGLERLAQAYYRWKRRRAARKFEVFMRKQNRTVSGTFDENGNYIPPDDVDKKNGGSKSGWVN